MHSPGVGGCSGFQNEREGRLEHTTAGDDSHKTALREPLASTCSCNCRPQAAAGEGVSDPGKNTLHLPKELALL